MKKIFKKTLFFSFFSRFSSQPPLFSDIFQEKTPISKKSKNVSFFDLSLKNSQELVLWLSTKNNNLSNLSFKEKLFLLEKLASSKEYSLELVESVMSQIHMSDSREFYINLSDFLEVLRLLKINSIFPQEFQRKISLRIGDFLFSEEKTNKKWIILEKISRMNDDFFCEILQKKQFLGYFPLLLEGISKENLKILIKILVKNKNINIKPLLTPIFYEKIDILLIKEWDIYMNLLRILSLNENFPLSDEFFQSILDFIFIELEGHPDNSIYFIRHLNYLIYKQQKNNKTVIFNEIHKGIILSNLRKEKRNLSYYEAVLMIFIKVFRNNTSDIQEILYQMISLSLENEALSHKISLFSSISKILNDEDFRKNKWLKSKVLGISNKILKNMEEIISEEIENIDSKDLALFFNTIVKFSHEKNSIKIICSHIMDKTLFFIKNNVFKFPTLLNILKIAAEMEYDNKYFHIILEEKIMDNIEEFLTKLQLKDILLMKKCFKSLGFGSRKLYNFIENASQDLDPANVRICWKNYKEREAKYIDLIQKRKNSFQADKLKN